MKVQCITNKLQDSLKDSYPPFDQKSEFPVEINTTYIVYGIMFYNQNIWYYLDQGTYYPYANPACLFNIVDTRLSRFWHYNHYNNNNINKAYGILCFSEWSNNNDFYSYLVDGEEEQVNIFRKYKKLMDIEFPDPSIEKKAINTEEDNWIICPECDEAWQHDSLNGMVYCPKCSAYLHNPLYKNTVISQNFKI